MKCGIGMNAMNNLCAEPNEMGSADENPVIQSPLFKRGRLHERRQHVKKQ